MSRKIQNRIGQKFGRLTIVKYAFVRNGLHYWHCKCECGNTKIVQYSNLASKGTVSCGCYLKDITGNRNKTHGLTNAAWMPAYRAMIRRCFNQLDNRYLDYGGRGITVCNEWRNIEAFANWCETNGYKKGLQLDRINNNGNYEPSNCRFITAKQNLRNKRSNVYILYKGKTKTLSEWCETLKLKYDVIQQRIKYRNWSHEKALSTPIRKFNKKHK